MTYRRRIIVPSDQIIAGGLKSYLDGAWLLDEASGARADRSGLANTLTDNATVTGATGPSGLIPLASQFTAANSEFLSIADNSFLSMGANTRCSLVAWVYATAFPANQMGVMCKFNTTGDNREYGLLYDNTANRFQWFANPTGLAGGSVTVDANTFGAPTAATWYFVYCDYDGANLRISVNNGALDATAYTSDIFNGASAFTIGSVGGNGSNFWDGRIAFANVWKRVLTAEERTWLYNAGVGRSHSQRRL